MTINYFWSSIVFMNVVYIFETYLDWRSFRKFQEKETPKEIREIIDLDTFDRARIYGRDKARFSLLRGFFSHLQTMLVLLLGGLPFLWRTSGNLLLARGYDETFVISQSCIFLILSILFEKTISFPWTIYYTFVIEHKHGFNKQTFPFFLKDQLKGLVLSLSVMLLVLSILLRVIEWGGVYFYFYAWVFLLCFSILAITVYADYIAPLFDTFEPLPEGSLKTKIENLAAKIDFPLTKLLVVKASKRSSHSNAYFYGFFKNKRIVLFDTLFKDDEISDSDSENDPKKASPKKNSNKCSEEEVVAILSHELGHWKLNHVLKNFFASQCNIFLSFFLFGFLMNSQQLFHQFGFVDSTPLLIGLILIFEFVFAPMNIFIGFCFTVLSRRYEFQADAFGVQLGYGEFLKSALVKIQKGNLGNMNPDRWYSLYHYSHPPLVERLAAITENLKKIK